MAHHHSNRLDGGKNARYRDLSLFLLATFGVSWILWIPLLIPPLVDLMPLGGHELITLGAFGPALGALAVLRLRRSGIGGWFRRRFRLRVSLRWYLAAFGMPAGIPTVAGVVFIAAGGDPASHTPPPFVLPLLFAYATLVGGGQEEIGWRGIAQPLVEGRYGMFIGGAVVGVFWVLWHLPLFMSAIQPFESTNPIVFGFQTVGVSVLLAWLYERSGQRLVPAMLFHGWWNTTQAFYPPDMLARSIAAVVIWTVVFVVAAVERKRAGCG
jgi:membrane protease YdiL (CAAX protease family)